MLHPTRYGEVVNRYLGGAGCPDLRPAHHPARPTRPAPRFTGLVLACVDESPDSYVALDNAAIEAELRGWDLRLVHVQSGAVAGRPDRDSRLLERMTARVYARSRAVAVTSRPAVGAPAGGLAAEAEKADLLVVGGRHGIAGAAFGLTVGDRAAAGHGGPALVVRMPAWPPAGEFVQRPIIAAVDGSPGSAPVAEFALAEARVRGCDVILLHPAGDVGSPRDRVETVRGVPVHHRVDGDDPVAALAGICDRVAAMVVGRQVRGPVADSLPGSPGRAVLEHARCPLFLVG